MTISPSQAEAEAVALARIYAEAEATVLRLIADRLSEGMESPQWAQMKLRDLRVLRAEIEAQIAKLDASAVRQLELLIDDAYLTGVNGAVADLTAANIEPRLIRTNEATVRALVNEAILQQQSTHLAILRQAEDAYRNAVAAGVEQAAAGVETRRQAAQRVLDDLANRGISGFVDSAGRRWGLSEYAEMSTRTALGRAAVQGHIDTLIANDRDLVIISNSPEECPLCRPYEGKVFSLTGGTPGYPLLDEARAGGLFHPNCTHRTGLYVPGLTQPMRDTANPQGYNERQMQRYLERNIRHWKRREAVALDDVTRQRASNKVRDWQERARDFISDTDRRRRYDRETITRAT